MLLEREQSDRKCCRLSKETLVVLGAAPLLATPHPSPLPMPLKTMNSYSNFSPQKRLIHSKNKTPILGSSIPVLGVKRG